MEFMLDDKAEEDNLLSLARLLYSSVTVRGPRLAIVKKLSAEYVVKIHTDLIDYTLRKFKHYQDEDNKQARNTVVLMFKTLAIFLNNSLVEGQEALKMWVPSPSLHTLLES